MNFVNQLEDYLRDLGAEARKKHPGAFQMISFDNGQTMDTLINSFFSYHSSFTLSNSL